MKKPWNYHLSENWADEKDRIRRDMRREKMGTIIGLICVVALAALMIT